MEIRSFNSELATATLQFTHIFSNIFISRTDVKTRKTTEIHVPCLMGQRSRVLKNWEDTMKRAHNILPVIIINRTGYQRNGERLNDLHNEVKYEITSKKRSYDLLTPVPIDITFDVSLISKTMDDIDQMISNILICFNNDGFVQSEHPKYEGVLMRNQFVLGDTITEEYPDELDPTTDELIVATMNFTFKTNLFGGTQKATKTPGKILSTYLSTFTSSYISSVDYKTLSTLSNASLTDGKYNVVLTSQVTTELTTTIDNPDPESDVYEGLVPIINTIDMGFYPTPYLSGHIENFDFVDSLDENIQEYYVDRIRWIIGKDGKSTILR